MELTLQSYLKKAFTLIELLIVVAIIGILSTIALVNYQHAQARGKVARVHSDMRTISGALEAFRLDRGKYPAAAHGDYQIPDPLIPLSSPVPYITSIPRDPFGRARFNFAPSIVMHGYNYKDKKTTSEGMPGETYGHIWKAFPNKEYFIHPCGPNKIWNVLPYIEYDPTNGTVSTGDICLFGPM